MRILRQTLALLFFILILLFFIDFNNKLPLATHGLLNIQFIPALLAGAWVIMLALLIATLLFGRVYCSIICPAGILQDFIMRISGRGRKKKRWFIHHQAYNIIRYGLLGVIAFSFLLGSSSLVMLFDPYSNFGRIAANLFRPMIIEINNLLAIVLMNRGNYTLFHITIESINTASFTIGIISLILFTVMSTLRGRLFCNTLCPVGAILSLVSHFSLFKISFNLSACNSCGNCERTCKSECINSKAKTIDNSRCVTCFNCTTSCNKGGMHYGLRLFKTAPIVDVQNEKQFEVNSRRTFLATTATLIATSSLIPSWAKANNTELKEKQAPITPPGSLNRLRFEEKCTACHLCVSKCPNQILHPATFQYGISYFLKPEMVYNDAYCNYECTICSEVCPNNALEKLTKEVKVTTQIGIAHFEKEYCVAYIDETDCGACSEHCPTQAVRMISYKGSLRVPQVDPSICVGCGGCEQICPARPQRAIHVVANEVHQKVNKPHKDAAKVKKVDNFGF